MSDKEKEPKQKEKHILKLFSNNGESSDEINSSDIENSRKNNTNKSQKILTKKTYKEDDNSGYNSYNLKIYTNKEENNHSMNSSEITNEKEITIGKLYSYRRPYSKYRRKLIFILICIINILINCDHGAIPAGTKELKEAKKFNQYRIRHNWFFCLFRINIRLNVRWIFIFNLFVKMGYN